MTVSVAEFDTVSPISNLLTVVTPTLASRARARTIHQTAARAIRQTA
jgi:hypothetical protein